MPDLLSKLFTGCLMLGLVGCSLSESNYKDEKLALAANQQIWERDGYSNYQFQLSKQCFCDGDLYPVIIVVKSDSVHAALDPESGDTLRVETEEGLKPVLKAFPGVYETVPQLFKVIDNAIAREVKVLNIQYDKELGYPTAIDIDIADQMADDEVSFKVETLMPSHFTTLRE